jgi:acetyltransferase-like isoleucine patch superfamily enzyme|tara:strand:- start:1045 stop:1800 length:756 start_codon:yes stop_codon:yes gene_type:complete
MTKKLFSPLLLGDNIHIGDKVNFGKNVVLYDNVIIKDEITIGNNCVIYSDSLLETGCYIHDGCIIGRVPKSRPKSRNVNKGEIPGSIIQKEVIFGTNSLIYRGSSIGKNSFIADNVWIREKVMIENNVVLGTGVQVMNNSTIHSHSRVMNNSHITEHVIIGEYTFIGPNVTTLASNSFGRGSGSYKPDPIIIGRAVRIGGNATIMPGIKIGEESLIAAGSVVINDVPDEVGVMGNPAKMFKKVKAEEKLNY